MIRRNSKGQFIKGSNGRLGSKHTTESKLKLSQNKERAKNISLAMKGKPKSEEHKKHLRDNHWMKREGYTHPMLGKKLPEVYKNLGKYTEKGNTPWNKGKKMPEGFGEIISIRNKGRIGEKAFNWKGGVNPINDSLRKSSMFKVWRELVFLRDNFTCQNPNCEYCYNRIGVMLHPHHIKPFATYPELRFDMNNGITYCKEFHINSKILHKGIIIEVS